MQAVGGGWCDLSCRTRALRNVDLGERELLIQGLKQQWGILVDGHAITSMREDMGGPSTRLVFFSLILVVTNWKWRQSFDIFSPWKNLEALEIAAWMCWTAFKTLLTSDQVVVFYAFLEVSKSHCDLFEGQAQITGYPNGGHADGPDTPLVLPWPHLWGHSDEQIKRKLGRVRSDQAGHPSSGRDWHWLIFFPSPGALLMGWLETWWLDHKVKWPFLGCWWCLGQIAIIFLGICCDLFWYEPGLVQAKYESRISGETTVPPMHHKGIDTYG